jgi:F-type H+-transporting ATPase subunit b
MNLFGQFSLGLFIMQVFLFVGLLLLLRKFAWKPILESVNAREEGIREALLSAEMAKKEMMALKADNQKLLDEARAERDTMIKEATAIKEKMIADAKEEANTQGAKMIEQAKATIEAEKNAAMADIKNQVSSLSLDIAEKLLKQELTNKDSQTALVAKLLDDVKLN